MIRIAVGTGLRRGELLNLRWGDVDLDSGHLAVRNRDDFTAKNGNERTVPLRRDALETLQEMNEARTPLNNEPVFVDADGNVPKPDRVSKRFKFYVRKAKLSRREDLSFHEVIRGCPARKRGEESCGLTGLKGRSILAEK
jgi:integrase